MSEKQPVQREYNPSSQPKADLFTAVADRLGLSREALGEGVADCLVEAARTNIPDETWFSEFRSRAPGVVCLLRGPQVNWMRVSPADLRTTYGAKGYAVLRDAREAVLAAFPGMTSSEAKRLVEGEPG